MNWLVSMLFAIATEVIASDFVPGNYPLVFAVGLVTFFGVWTLMGNWRQL